MSKKQLDYILSEAIKVMETDLRNEVNLQTQVVLFTPARIREAVLRQLRFTYSDGTKKYKAWQLLDPSSRNLFINQLESRAKSLNGEILAEYKKLKVPGINIEVSGTAKRFTVTVTVLDEKELTNYGKYTESAFSAVKKGYKRIMEDLWLGIGDYLQGLTGSSDDNFSGSAFDLEHAFGQSIAEKRVSAGVDTLYNKVLAQVNSEKAAQQVFKELGLEVWLDFVSTDSITSAKLYVGSSSKNRAQATQEKQLLNKAKDSLTTVLANYMAKDVRAWRGSDDRVEIEKKKIVETFNKSVKLKTKSIDTKRNLSKTTTKKKVVKTKSKKSTQKTAKKIPLVAKEKVLARKRKPAKSTISLAALINQKLPETVAKNMRLPGLQYRSGRFAGSVRVTDITSTSQGFPSIGYTYQKYPYQTFEPGFARGSADRDPRKVIDKSIREIARELLIGRLYTRRV